MSVRVVGGGILGCAAALALAEEGHEVVLQEALPATLQATSSRSAGIVSTFTHSPEDAALVQRTRGAIGEIISLTAGIAPHARNAWKAWDSLAISQDGALLDRFQSSAEAVTEEPERLGAKEAQRQFPMLRIQPDEEVLIAQEDGVLEVGDFQLALDARLDMEGVEIERGKEFNPDHALIEEDTLVLACGYQTRHLVEALGGHLAAQGYRCQAGSVMTEAEVPIVHDLRHGIYLRPESEGSLLVGDGTRLDRPLGRGDDHGQADDQFAEDIAYGLLQRIPSLDQAQLRAAWSGIAVATPDKQPLIGQAPDLDDVFVLTGDQGFGVMRSLALGEELALAVDGQGQARFDPRRFEELQEPFVMQEGYGVDKRR